MSEFIITGIGKKIKEIRIDNGRKLTEVAQAADISKGLLSKIENGRTVPSLPVLLSIIKALKLRPDDFFAALDYEKSQTYIHKSAEQLLPIKKEEENKGYKHYSILDKVFKNFRIESEIIEVLPGAYRKKLYNNTYQFRHVLEGSLQFHLNQEVILLKKGDSLLFDGHLEHLPLNETDQSAKMLAMYFYHNK